MKTLGRCGIVLLGVWMPMTDIALAEGQATEAVACVEDFQQACRADEGSLWGETLCGPLIAVDGTTGLAVATRRPPAGRFEREGGLWRGRVPEGMQVANTAMEWDGERWSTVRLPLPKDEFLCLRLLIHESFHRIQPNLGLEMSDAINPHLEQRDGRYLLRLELRAMVAALLAEGDASRQAVRDALLFRAERYRLYPEAEDLESSLEIQEGLPEYTGTRLALDRTGEPLSRVADSTTQFEERPTYARALGYGTGPLLGLLLDRYAEDWRTRLPVDSMASQLNRAFGFELPAGSAEAVAARAEPYGGEALAHEEDARAEARRSLLADYQVRLVDGPVLVLGAEQLFRGFDPNSLVPLEGSGTVYPTGSFRGPWGRLTVEAGGALVSHDNRTVQVPRPGDFDPSQRVIEGAGWHLELESDWRFEPGPREGDAKVVAITP